MADIPEDCVLVLLKADPQALFPSEQARRTAELIPIFNLLFRIKSDTVLYMTTFTWN